MSIKQYQLFFNVNSKKLALAVLMYSLVALPKMVSQIIMSDNVMVQSNTCGANFLDSGGSSEAYHANENATMTICSDDPNKKNIALAFDEINLSQGDELCFFDGKTVNDPSLGCASDFGQSSSILETTTRNKSGCMTVTFHSDSSNQGNGWLARILCIPSCQTVKAKIETTTPAISPSDTGWIDACVNKTRVLFNAKGVYDLNDISYHQSDTLSKFEWNFGDGSPIAYGSNVAHVFTKTGGFVTKLTVTDTMGCQNTNFIKQRIRISSKPLFSLSALSSQICAGQEIKLRGLSTKIDPNYQVSAIPKTDSFSLGEVHSEELFIPDDGTHEYRTSVYFTDFNPGQTLQNATDLQRIYASIEHSWARDLEVKIVCPNQQQAILTRYDAATRDQNHINIGIPNTKDDKGTGINNPLSNPAGTGLEYAWTPLATQTWRSYTTPINISLPVGDYASEDPLSNLVGCPLNGQWSIVVKDEYPQDNGWIFYWGIDFNKSLYPNIETFTPTVVNHTWLSNPTITSFSQDSIIAKPRNGGIASYIYQLRDNFNCLWDTSFNVSVMPPTLAACAACNTSFNKLSDTTICKANFTSMVLDKTALTSVNNSVTFDANPNSSFNASGATLVTPNVSTITVSNIFTPKLTSPLTQIDSVCVDINSPVADDYVITLKPPSTNDNNNILLKPQNVGGVKQQIRSLCFTPTATRAIETASAPLTGAYLPVGGATTWNKLVNFPINGNWQLLSTILKTGHTDTLLHWSITFKSGNGLSYSWTPTTGLSCSTCAAPIAKPTTTTQYKVTITDSTKCVYTDAILMTINDSLAAPAVVNNVTQTTANFVWTAVPNATGYEVSSDNGKTWITPNGTLKHSFTNLTSGQKINFSVRATNATNSCGAKIAQEAVTTLVCAAKIGQLGIDSVPCFGQKSPLIVFKSASGVAPITYQIDNISHPLNSLFKDTVGVGRHTAYVIGGDGCKDSTIFYLGQPDTISLTKSADSVKCFGTSTGRIVLNAVGGVGKYVYSLNGSVAGRTMGMFDSLPKGKYLITVLDSNRCSFHDSITVYEPPVLALSLAKQDIQCAGNATGTIQALSSGGTLPYVYNWDSGSSSTNVLTSLGAGKYKVTLTDARGCTKIDSTTILAPTAISLVTLQDSVKCFGDATGQARVRVTGGSLPYLFNWNNTQSDSVAIGLRAGNQRVTVTDAVGCTATSNVTVLQPKAMKFDSLVGIPTSCSNQRDGGARVVVSGGIAPYSYQWQGSVATTSSITNMGTGHYSVTATDRNGCLKVDSVSIDSPLPLTIDSFEISNLKCNGNSDGTAKVDVSGGTGTYTYKWNTTPTQTTVTASNLKQGKYTVTVTDQNKCTVSKDTTLTEPAILDVTITQYKNVKCKGDSTGSAIAAVSGGTTSAAYTYKWDDSRGQSTSTAINLPVGKYTVAVSDINGCSDTASVVITEPAIALQVFPIQTKLSCDNINTGEAKATATGGTGNNYSYRWSNLQITQTVTGLSKQTYYVTVTDLAGCKASDSVSIQTYDPIVAKLTTVLPRCNGTATGSFSLSAIAGGAGNGIPSNYSYRWSSSPVQTGEIAIKLLGGRNYTVSITDTEGCTGTLSQYLDQPAAISLSAFSVPVNCYGGATGQALVNAIGSVNSFTYQWNDATKQTTQQAVGLIAGRYNVTVTDSTGCKRDTFVDVTEPSRLKVDSKIIANSKCVGDTTGSISVNLTGGVEPYKYAWSNGSITNTIQNVRAGTYIVTISDLNGCNLFDTISIKSPTVLDADITTKPVTCFGGQNGVITVSAFGGTPPYYYSLNNKTFNGVSQMVGVKAASYNVFVKDANNCVWFDNATVATPPKFIVDATPDVTINIGDKTQLFAVTQNNQGAATLTWKQPYDSTLTCLSCPDPIASPLSSVLYIVNGVDSAGCRSSDSLRVTVVKPVSVLVPTGFTPNDDKVNDKLIVHGRTGTIITLFRVYDRWGELLYEAKNFPINDEASGWDGKFKDAYMNSGEYVWYIEALYIDKTTEIFKGHTTLIR